MPKLTTKKSLSAGSPSASELSDFTILIDTREPAFQAYSFSAFGVCLTERIALPEGDYAVKGLVGKAALERKTLDDLAKSITEDRFWAELDRAKEKAYPRFCIIVEGTMEQAAEGLYSSQVKPEAVLGACLSITARYGFPVIWAGNRQAAALYTFQFLRKVWELRSSFLSAPTETKEASK